MFADPRTVAPIHAAVLALTLATAASAHEFWIAPDQMHLQPGELLRVRLHHGERFAGDVVPRDESMIERFELITPAGSTPVRGLHGHEQSFLRPDDSGFGTIVYQSSEYTNTLPGDRFEAYLREEGLDEISRCRAARGETDAIGREAYVRCAKTLITVGQSDQPAVPVDSPVGLPFELVLESCGPISASQPVVALVLLRGAPAADVRVVAASQANHEQLIELRTDAAGRISLAPDVAGAWMLTSLCMERLEGGDADWKSYWASLTFELPK